MRGEKGRGKTGPVLAMLRLVRSLQGKREGKESGPFSVYARVCLFFSLVFFLQMGGHALNMENQAFTAFDRTSRAAQGNSFREEGGLKKGQARRLGKFRYAYDCIV